MDYLGHRGPARLRTSMPGFAPGGTVTSSASATPGEPGELGRADLAGTVASAADYLLRLVLPAWRWFEFSSCKKFDYF